MKREGTHQNMALPHYCCVRFWVVRCSLVGIPPRCAFVFQSGMEEPHQALSIIHLTCHHHNPPTERPQEWAYKWKLLRCERCELEWKENHNRGVRERERMTGDEQGWGERKGVEGGWTIKKQRGDRWLLQRKWQRWRAEEKMSKHWYSTQCGFFTLEGTPLTVNFPVHLPPSATGFILCLP